MNLHSLDITALVTYMLLVAAMGFYFARRNTNTEEYFLGGRSFPGWAIGLSLVGTSISSITFLAYPGDSFKTAWIRYIANFALPIGAFIAAYCFIYFFRQGNTTTAYEYLEKRFGPSVRVYGALAFIFAQLVRISIILYLLAILIHELTGIDTTWCIIIGGVFVGAYTVVGGFDAVIWTDVIQTIVLLLGGVICLFVIIDLLPGGLEQIFSVANEHNKLSFSELRDGQLHPIPWGVSLGEKTVSMLLIAGLVHWLTEYCGNQNTVQRYCASRSDSDARKALLVCAVGSLPIWAFYMFLGTSLFVFFQQFPTPETGEMLDGTRKAEQVLPFFILNNLPPGIAGIVIAAALAAAMSSLDSSINAISTVSIIDIYKRHFNRDSNDKHYLRCAWLIASATSVFMVIGAWLLSTSETKTLHDTASVSMSILGGGLLGMYLMGFCTTRGDARAVWCGILCTVVFTAWTILAKKGLLPENLTVPFDLYYTGLVGNLVMFTVGFTAASIITRKPKDLTNLTFFTKSSVATTSA